MRVKAWLTLLLCCWLHLGGFAQPGRSGGSLRFRLFDAKGLIINSQRNDYRCFATWQRTKNQYANWSRTFSPEADGYWRYAAYPAAHSGAVPPGFTVNVVHGRDTMRIQGLHGFHYHTLQVDSIPFRAGRFFVPPAYVPLLNMRVAAGRITNFDWALLRTAGVRPDRLTAERLVLRPTLTGSPPDTVVPACSRLTVRYAGEASADVYLTAPAGQPPKLLLRHVPQLQSVACAGPRLLVLTGNLVLRSDDEGATWRLGQVREEATVSWWQRTIDLNEFRIRQAWFDPQGQVLVSGTRTSNNVLNLPGFYELHFTPDTTAAVVRRSYAQARADMRAWLLRRARQQEAEFRQRLHQEWNTPQHQTFVQQRLLLHCQLMQNNSYVVPATRWQPAVNQGRSKSDLLYPERPILTLQDGQFQYKGSNWANAPTLTGEDESIVAADFAGAYTFTDSTITFQPRPAVRAPTMSLRYRQDFYPSGTYYYYYQDALNRGQPLIILTRPVADFTRHQEIALRVRQ